MKNKSKIILSIKVEQLICYIIIKVEDLSKYLNKMWYWLIFSYKVLHMYIISKR